MCVEQRPLKACIRAHVFADLLAHVAGVAVGRKAIEADPEQLPAASREAHQRCGKLADVAEVADESAAGEQRKGDPQNLLGALAQELGAAPAGTIELDALLAATLGEPLQPDENFGPYRLRAGIAAPQAPGQRGAKEQRQ